MKFAVLMTCFNRVETTLECLRHLFVAKLPNGVSFEVWLNDDTALEEGALLITVATWLLLAKFAPRLRSLLTGGR